MSGRVHVHVRTVYPDDYLISPDCAVGKHVACSGGAWDFEYDAASACECDCHDDADDADEPVGGVR